jgi:hypothetical protein
VAILQKARKKLASHLGAYGIATTDLLNRCERGGSNVFA